VNTTGTETTSERTARLLDEANKARHRGDHVIANVYIALLSVDVALPRPASAGVQQQRQRKKDSFSANPFST